MVFLPLFVLLSFASVPTWAIGKVAYAAKAIDSELVFDMTDKANNAELGSDQDGMHVIAQIVPGAMSLVWGNLKPCGVVLAHSKANVDAMVYVLESNPQVEMSYVNDEGAVVVLSDIKKGMTVLWRRGVLRWFTNKSCKEGAKGLKFFNGDSLRQELPALEVATGQPPEGCPGGEQFAPPPPSLPPRPRSGSRWPTRWWLPPHASPCGATCTTTITTPSTT
jgi:hypothetical protein